MICRDEIERKLKEFSPRVAAAVGLRAAARVLPVLAVRQARDEPFGYWTSRDRSDHVLAILRCYQVSYFGNSFAQIDCNGDTAASAVTADDSAVACIGADVNEITAAAANVASYVSYASYTAAASDTAAITAAAAADAAAATTAATTSDDAAYIAAADAAAYAASAYATEAAIAIALEEDFEIARHNHKVVTLLDTPLWPKGIPDTIEALWKALRNDLRSLHDTYDIWIDWYRDRLDGWPLDLELERKWALLPHDVLELYPAEINKHLKMLRNDHYRSQNEDKGDAIAPDLPENQEPGFQYGHGSDGRIVVQHSGLATPDDAAEIATMQEILIKAIDTLVAMTNSPNELAWVGDIATLYLDAITAEGPPIDDIYGYGTWLENAYEGVKAQIATEDYPDLAHSTTALINTVIAIHGPLVASTERGQILIGRARDFADNQVDTATYKLKAQEFAQAVSCANDAVTADVRKQIRLANDNISCGPHPYRSTETARTANENLLLTSAKRLISGIESGAADSISGAATVVDTPVKLYAIKTFFITNMLILREFAIIPGFEIRWLPPFLNWLEAQHVQHSGQSYRVE